MVVSDVLFALNKFHVVRSNHLEDFADRFNCNFTVIILLISSIIVGLKQYVFRPIVCHAVTPNMMSGAYATSLLQLMENYCWVQGTVPISSDAMLPDQLKDWKLLDSEKTMYYQWVPFTLAFQCVIFYIPRLLWQTFCYSRAGTNLEQILANCAEATAKSRAEKADMIKSICYSIEHMLVQHREYRKGRLADLRQKLINICIFFVFSKRLGTWLCYSYILFKGVQLGNILLQLYFMYLFLNISSSGPFSFGYTLLMNIKNGRTWESTLMFPRKGFCPLNVPSPGAKNNLIVGICALPVNMLNERIFIFLYFWMLLALVFTGISIPIWVWRLMIPHSKESFIQKYLELGMAVMNKPITSSMTNEIDYCHKKNKHVNKLRRFHTTNCLQCWSQTCSQIRNNERKSKSELVALSMTKSNEAKLLFINDAVKNSTNPDMLEKNDISNIVKKFMHNFLRSDGIFLMKMIEINVGDLITVDIVVQLWNIYTNCYMNMNFLRVERSVCKQQETSSDILHLNNQCDNYPRISDEKLRKQNKSNSKNSNTDMIHPTAPSESPNHILEEVEDDKRSNTNPENISLKMTNGIHNDEDFHEDQCVKPKSFSNHAKFIRKFLIKRKKSLLIKKL